MNTEESTIFIEYDGSQIQFLAEKKEYSGKGFDYFKIWLFLRKYIFGELKKLSSLFSLRYILAFVNTISINVSFFVWSIIYDKHFVNFLNFNVVFELKKSYQKIITPRSINLFQIEDHSKQSKTFTQSGHLSIFFYSKYNLRLKKKRSKFTIMHIIWNVDEF